MIVFLTLTVNTQIPVWAYIREKSTAVPRFSKVSGLSKGNTADPEQAKVDRVISYHLRDDDETEVSSFFSLLREFIAFEVQKELLAKAYKYGKSLVPFLKTDEVNMKLQAEKCLKILAFVKSAKVSQYSVLLGSSIII